MEIKHSVLSNGAIIKVLKRNPVELRFEIKSSKHNPVRFFVETTWLSTHAVLDILALDKESLLALN